MVLIVSYWNLNAYLQRSWKHLNTVLIVSYWNLNLKPPFSYACLTSCINSFTLEFKYFSFLTPLQASYSINSFTLEFKC